MTAHEIAGEPFSFRFSNFEIDGTPFTQIQVPTIPVPVEPTFSVANGWLVAGLTPQACMAAVRQVSSSGGDITNNPSYRTAMAGTPDLTSVTFIDSARTIRDGYPYLTMLGSAVSNMVRPKSLDAPRALGMVTPLYADLIEDVKPYVNYTYWEGNDYVTEGRSDASILVNIAAMLGVGDIGDIASSMLVGGGIGAAIANETRGEVDRKWEEEWQEEEEWEAHEQWDEDEEDHHHNEH